MTSELLIEVAQSFVAPGARRVEGLLVENGPYHWKVLVEHIDLDHPELSYVVAAPLPGVQGINKARWLAWELGFDVSRKETCL